MFFKSPNVGALYAVSIRLPRRIAGATSGLHEDSWWGDCREFFEWAICLNPERGPWSRARRPMRDRLDKFSHFMVITAVAPSSVNFAISGGTAGRRCCGHICAEGALHWDYSKRTDAVITTPEKERLCIALSVFLNRTGLTMILILFNEPRWTKIFISSK